ncbi:uncharacterized protein Bfra_001782, partial [Botrytis fragariae]
TVYTEQDLTKQFTTSFASGLIANSGLRLVVHLLLVQTNPYAPPQFRSYPDEGKEILAIWGNRYGLEIFFSRECLRRITSHRTEEQPQTMKHSHELACMSKDIPLPTKEFHKIRGTRL